MKNSYTRREILGYVAMPRIFPRIKDLFVHGFQLLPYFIALVYQAVRLLPARHPYTDTRNIGKFGLRNVLGEAANNLVINKNNIDQIIVYFAVLAGMILTLIQVVLFGITIFSQPVIAGTPAMPTNFKEFFIAPNEEHDLAHMMLDMTFGVPGIFKSCITEGGACQTPSGVTITGQNLPGDPAGPQLGIISRLGPVYPIHNGLHALLQLYSVALLVVATIITAYFIFTIIAETAQTGTAFGKRYNKVWAPIRLVVAFGLLVPISNGLNSSQYIVLYAAKFGSGFASNGWRIFNEGLSGENLLQKEQLVSEPNTPEGNSLLQFMYAAAVCKELEAQFEAYKFSQATTPTVPNFDKIKGYLVRGNLVAASNLDIENTTYEQLLNFSEGSNQAIIRFGYVSAGEFSGQLGNVGPVCGELILPLNDPRIPSTPSNPSSNPPEEGPRIMQEYYWDLIKDLWVDVLQGNISGSTALSDFSGKKPACAEAKISSAYGETYSSCPGEEPTEKEYALALNAYYKNGAEKAIKEAIDAQKNSPSWDPESALAQKGWGAAGLWYNRVARLNGAMTESALGLPNPRLYPELMEYVAYKKSQQDKNVDPTQRFNPSLADKTSFRPRSGQDINSATALWNGFSRWQKDGLATTTHNTKRGNIFIDAISHFMGTDGLFSMRKNENVHPLAQLTGIGKSLIQSSIRNFGYATVSAGAGLVFPDIAGGTQIFISIVMTLLSMTLTVGFVLYYVVPFLPFIYFFFAIGGWIKGIFEAMVGAPLWALAHIRIDGEGLPGPAATTGYFLIFEIFLRPILIVFGLLGSLTIFSALVSGLNETWDLVVSNLTGFDHKLESEAAGSSTINELILYARSPLDQFFFTVLYALIVYLMALSSFKLIDQIPNQILRWMGNAASTFHDEQENPVAGLTGKAVLGANQVAEAGTQSIGGGLGSINSGFKK